MLIKITVLIEPFFSHVNGPSHSAVSMWASFNWAKIFMALSRAYHVSFGIVFGLFKY